MRKDSSEERACKKFERDVVFYGYGESTGENRKRIESHLADCGDCRRFLEQLRAILSLTSQPDNPPEAFWERYSREMRAKLAVTERTTPWRDILFSLFRLWPVPALAAALVLILVLALTFSETVWRPRQNLPVGDDRWVQIHPVADNLEFFKTMDLLDSMDLLEAVDAGNMRHRGT